MNSLAIEREVPIYCIIKEMMGHGLFSGLMGSWSRHLGTGNHVKLVRCMGCQEAQLQVRCLGLCYNTVQRALENFQWDELALEVAFSSLAIRRALRISLTRTHPGFRPGCSSASRATPASEASEAKSSAEELKHLVSNRAGNL